ncbi:MULTISPECIES: FAD-binding protein [unclassified Crossiella]|uniref:FAD-binding protein n=1 Tax=unclassified Crossiella TaxID=2620835 RepID=UPI001FFEB2C6|nr:MULTISPECIES: FAD-binding protein [unclassified Crossiella]MCK2240911.1 FAD-binding protein [Crossiella sp. S99.2]MCK2253945.1 FAD-binding protein [Crossiella sp. S99.1]
MRYGEAGNAVTVQGMEQRGTKREFEMSLRGTTSKGMAEVAGPHWLPELREVATREGWDGRVSVVESMLRRMSRGASNLQEWVPGAVYVPRTAEGVRQLIAWAGPRGVEVAVRGAGHSMSSHALTKGGVVIAMADGDGELTEVGPVRVIEPGQRAVVTVGAGATLVALEETAMREGYRPAAGLPDYHGLTLGGVLSVGGLSAFPRKGAVIDEISALTLVTGDGTVMRATPQHHAEVFHAALGGLGVIGVITSADVELVPVAGRVQMERLRYAGLGTALAAMETLLADDACHELYLWVQRPDKPGEDPVCEVHAYVHTHEADPEPVKLPEHLRPRQSNREVVSYADRSRMITDLFTHLQERANWNFTLKMWDDVLLDWPSAEPYLASRIADLTEQDWDTTIPQFVLAFPHRRSAFTRPAFALPTGSHEYVVSTGVLRDLDQVSTGADVADRVASIGSARERALATVWEEGGVAYPYWDFWKTGRPWPEQFGPRWEWFSRTVEEHSPYLNLNAGTGLPSAIRATRKR